MLTLKVETWREGVKSTFIISGDKISYNQEMGDPGKDFILDGMKVFGSIPRADNTPVNLEFSYFGGRITDKENAIVMDFMVFPHSHVYIMNDAGQTVDHFTSEFLR